MTPARHALVTVLHLVTQFMRRCAAKSIAIYAGALATIAALSAASSSAQAHPHMFFNATAQFVVDEAKQIKSVRVAFLIDEYNTLLTVAELGLDEDRDGALSQADEQKALETIVEGFGHYGYFTELTASGNGIPLGDPSSGAAWLESGQLGVVMDLPLTGTIPLSGAQLDLALYDPTYFTAISLAIEPQLVSVDGAPFKTSPDRANGDSTGSAGANSAAAATGGPECSVNLKKFDADQQTMELQSQLAELSREETPADATVGALFADRVTLRCAA